MFSWAWTLKLHKNLKMSKSALKGGFRLTVVIYESSIFIGLKVMAKVKVFVHATAADADTDGRAMTLAPRTFVPAR